jgi:catechol 2,3-dioxygenase-like lactoylglutathione lyase family enzyme
MLANHPVYPTLPTADLATLRRFYEDILGFPVKQETPKTVDGIADMGAGHAALIRDPDGNLIGIFQFKPGA